MERSLVTEDEARSRLQQLRGWSTGQNGSIGKTFEFKDFPHALLFVNAVGHLAEKLNHHPDITLRWNRVMLSLTTDSAQGLTHLDFTLAEQVERSLV